MRSRTLLVGVLLWAFLLSVAPVARAEDAPPHVRINTPDHGATVSGVVVISGNAWDDYQVLGVKVRIDTGEWLPTQDTSGNDSWWSWAREWDTTLWPDGWHHIGAITWDNASQHGDAGIEVYVDNTPDVDNHAPWVAIDSPPGGSTVSGVVTIEGRSGDDDDNDTVEMVQVKIDMGEWNNATPTGDNGSFGHWAFDWNTTLYEDGWHVVRARAFDGELYSEPAAKEYLVDNVPNENTAPFAEIVHPKNEQVVWGIVLVHGVAGDHDDGDRVELVQVAIGDGPWNDAVDTSHDDSWSTWAWQWDTRQYDNGVRHVCARAFDGDLYSEPNCRFVRVANENHRPGVHIEDPVNGQKVHGTILIHGTAWDDEGVELVEIRFNEGEWTETVDTSPDGSWTTWAYEWDTTHRDDGCLYLSARSWDGSLFSEVHKIQVCVDNVNDRPIVKIRYPENEATVHGLILVWGTASDDHGVKVVQVRIDEGEWDEATDTGHERRWSTWAYEWDTTQVENGKHIVCARAYDGELWSELSCIHVFVENDDGGGGAPPAPLGGATPFLALGGAAALGVAILMWLRSHGYLRQ